MSEPTVSPEPGIEAPKREHRWPAAFASFSVLALMATLPSMFSFWPRALAIVFGFTALVPLIWLNPKRLNRQTVWSRWLSLGFSIALVVVNQWLMIELIFLLFDAGSEESKVLLIAALEIWIANLLMFSLLYWEIDRGGPVTRNVKTREGLPPADLKFTQDSDDERVDEIRSRASNRTNWRPIFLDYLFGAASFTMAFSPGDAMPLTHRLKVLMLVQSLSSFVMLVLVIARAVGAIG